MSITYRRYLPSALLVSGLLFGLALAAPAASAGQVMTIAPAEDRDAPEGSQIPEWRIEEAEEKARAYQERQLRQARPAQDQEAQPESDGSAPKKQQP